MNETTPLYTIKDHTGAYYLIKLHDRHPNPDTDETETRALVQLVGADENATNIPAADLAPYTMDNTYTGADLITILAQESVTIYGAEAKRVHRAAQLARNPYMIQPARRDENGEPVARASYKILAVKSSRDGWYVVHHGKCTCKDHQKGNVCKHRIAAWMRRESIARPLAAARRVETAIIMAELEA